VLKEIAVRRIFGYKKEEVTGGCKKLHNEELHNLYSSQNIRATKLRRITWARYVARMGEKVNAYRFGSENPK
jgi:hypothetical protein